MKSQKSIDKFLSSTTKRQLAGALKTDYKILMYNLHVLPEEKRYTVFTVPKKSGGVREIVAPISRIKHIQRKLATLLLEIYPEKNCVYGFHKGKNIKLNAEKHVNKRIIINIDLNDFFPSINFGRVLGLFKSAPFAFNDEVAIALAQICCYKKKLPQGAPTSPIVSNFICWSLDNALLWFARKNKFVYTRYADDITFSTNLKEIPVEFGFVINDKLILSQELRNIIETNGFKINENKTRYAFRNNRQKVTGLVVNEFPNLDRKYVRNIRAMIHAWEKYGIENAATEYFEKHKKTEVPNDYINIFRDIVIGKINFLRYIKHTEKGDAPVYRKFANQVKSLAPGANLAAFRNYTANKDSPIVMGEGVTDMIHLRAALDYFHQNDKFKDLQVNFPDERNNIDTNNANLMKFCESAKTNSYVFPQKIICLFDRDDQKINNKHTGLFIPWDNNVYSTLMPKPLHRDFDEICIEFYYPDEVLKLEDENGRRIYTSDEFDKNTGIHHTESNVCYEKINYLKSNYPRILDSRVFRKDKNGAEKSIALSKRDFAKKCAERKGNFKHVVYDNFEPIFHLISKIVKMDN